MNQALENYECENQETIQEWLWDIGYYMPLPVEKRESDKDGAKKNVHDENS